MNKKLIIIAWLIIIFMAPAIIPIIPAQAQDIQSTVGGLDQTAVEVDAFKAQATSGQNFNTGFLSSRVGYLIGIVLSFVGVVFLVLMIYAGILWMTARGNEVAVTKAKDLLINAIIGIIIVFAAYALTSFIGNAIISSQSQGTM